MATFLEGTPPARHFGGGVGGLGAGFLEGVLLSYPHKQWMSPLWGGQQSSEGLRVPGPYLSPPGFFVGDLSTNHSANLKKCTKSVQFYTLFPENADL